MSSIIEQQFREHFRAKWSLWAAVGAGCLVGVSGLLLMQRLSLRVDHSVCISSSGAGANVSKELASLHSTLKELRQEIQELRSKPPLRSALRTPTVKFESNNVTDDESSLLQNEENTASNSTDYFSARASGSTTVTDYFSAISSDEDEEFFELPPENCQTSSIHSDIDGTLLSHHGNHSKSKSSELEDYISHAERLSLEIQKLTEKEESEEERLQRLEVVHLFETVDGYMEGQADFQKKAYELLIEKDEPPLCDNGEFLWRLCKSTYLMAVAMGLKGDQAKKQELIFRAVDHGERAIKNDDNSSEAHKWFAIALGSRGEYLGIKEKILDGFEFKKHIDKASELAPQDHTIQHLLGRFCYEVAELSWWERKMAATLFADPPVATMEEAREHFVAAETLKPDGWIENRQFLAKCNINLQDYGTAINWLDKAIELPVKNPDDEQAQKEVEELLKQYEQYRER